MPRRVKLTDELYLDRLARAHWPVNCGLGKVAAGKSHMARGNARCSIVDLDPIIRVPSDCAALHSTIAHLHAMTTRLQRSVALLLVCVIYRDLPVSASTTQGSSAIPVSPLNVVVPSIGSVAAGCSLCRDSGNCSVAMNDTSSGVFCGDLHATDNTQACCCPYYTECRVTSRSQTCECGGPWPFATRHERLSAMETANETETLIQESFAPETDDPMDDQMSVSTEILIHLSAYLALFVFAVYVDQWVECFSDFRRNQMVTYGEAIDMKMLRFRQRFGKRRRDSETGTETDDNLPLLVLESPAPTSRPVFTFEEGPELKAEDTTEVVEVNEAVPEEVVVVTVPIDVVQEVDTSPPESPVELEEIPLE